MPRVSITREVHFSAAHRVFNPEWSDERNFEVFGACANPNWHGHDYVLYVGVEGESGSGHGFCDGLQGLEVAREIPRRRRHGPQERESRRAVDGGIIASAENIVVAIWDRLVDRLPDGVTLAKLTLWETPRHYVEYSGE